MAVFPPKFFPHFLQKCGFFRKKLLNEKIFETSFPTKKVTFIFIVRHPFPSRGTWPLETVFCIFLRKLRLFLKKLLNDKVFDSSFAIKKSYVNFWCETSPFPKKLSIAPVKQFIAVSLKIILFLKKFVE